MKGDEAAKERGMKILAGCVVFGLLLTFAQPLVSFITDINFASPPQNFPPDLFNKMNLLLETIKWGGAFLVTVGLIYGGYQYVKRTARP